MKYVKTLGLAAVAAAPDGVRRSEQHVECNKSTVARENENEGGAAETVKGAGVSPHL